MGPTCALSAPDGPHVGRMNLAIWVEAQKNAPQNICIFNGIYYICINITCIDIKDFSYRTSVMFVD